MLNNAPVTLELKHISKSFSGFKANDDISLTLEKGEIHAILGENGAGKSTLVKIIYGIQKADSGEIWLEGKKVHFKSPRAARKHGIGMIFQHFSLFEGMTVLENIALGLDEKLDMRELKLRVNAVLTSYSLPLDPDRMVYTLSVGEKQRIEIVRCLLQKPKIIIMDEPTSVLTPQEVKGLFNLLHNLKNEGVSILYISHKLQEIKALCDKASILRLGRHVGEVTPKNVTAKKMAELMIGNEIPQLKHKAALQFGDKKLQLNNLSYQAQTNFEISLQNISCEIRAGEILCIAGVAGNGQSELMRIFSGETVVNPNEILLNSKPIGNLLPHKRRVLGLTTVPEERNGHAAVPEMTLSENTLLTAPDSMKIVKNGLINWKKAEIFAKNIISQFDVRTRSQNSYARSLSGGNLQKFIMGREILQKPQVLIVSQPTWGVDAGAAVDIRQKLYDLSDEGVAIVVISQDLDELLEIGDKIAVLNHGKLTKPYDIHKISKADIGLLMGGEHV